MDQYKPHIVCITETWLNSNNLLITDLEYDKKYQATLANRQTKRGGGCALLIKSHITYTPIYTGTIQDIELIIIRLNTLKTDLCCIYRPPNSSLASLKKLT